MKVEAKIISKKLLRFHSFTKCDQTRSFFRYSKVTNLKVFILSNDAVQNAFQNVGHFLIIDNYNAME